MTVKELRQALSEYPDDTKVVFTIAGSKSYYWVDQVSETPYANNVCLECVDAPTFEDIEGMADMCWTTYHTDLTKTQSDALAEVSIKAAEAMRRAE